MAYINIKPLERTRVYETSEQAINHILIHRIWSKHWDYNGAPFGQTIETRRSIDAAIKTNNSNAFIAHKRRGYWRIELTDKL